jgi:hypothetical protein
MTTYKSAKYNNPFMHSVKADITALALREATNEASAAFNLPNQHIDTFATDTLGTKTNVAINAPGGFISSIRTGFAVDTSGTLTTSLANILDYDNNITDSTGTSTFTLDGYDSYSTSIKKLGTHSIRFTADTHGVDINHNSTNAPKWTTINQPFSISIWVYREADTGTWQQIWDGYKDGSSTIHCIMGLQHNGGDYRMSTMDQNGSWDYSSLNVTANTWHHCVFTVTTSKKKWYLNGTKQEVTGSYQMNGVTSFMRLFHRHTNAFGFRGYADQTCFWEKELSDQEVADLYNSGSGNVYSDGAVSATGTAIQAANTVASAKTKVGGTMLYKDNAGTATLGTDLKIYFTCDGDAGSPSWTEAASYNAITPVYSTGVKQVRLGETTCTSGTDIRYKAVWANQAASSKETQLHGIGINY